MWHSHSFSLTLRQVARRFDYQYQIRRLQAIQHRFPVARDVPQRPSPQSLTQSRSSSPRPADTPAAAAPSPAVPRGAKDSSSASTPADVRTPLRPSKAALLLSEKTTKQEAERVAREQRRLEAEKVQREIDQLSDRVKQLEGENAHLLGEVTIWKDAQTAASSLKQEMETLRRRQTELRSQISSQAATIEKLKTEKADMADEMKRLQRLAKDAERMRAAPTIVPTSSTFSSVPSEMIYEMVMKSQKQVLSVQIVQRCCRTWSQRKREAAERAEAARRKALRAYSQGAAAGMSATAAAAAAAAAAKAAETAAAPELERALSPAALQRLKAKDKEKLARHEGGKRDKAAAGADELSNRYVTSKSAMKFGFASLAGGFGGLERHVGTPSSDVRNAMEREHADETPFHSRYVRNTNPKQEWRYVVEMEVGELSDRRPDEKESRNGWRLADFVACDTSRAAGLTNEEVIGLRLYTGPMYVHYVVRVLRCGLQDVFTSTIHSINSAIVKLAKLPKPLVVYRGVRGGALPKAFFVPDGRGNAGGVETGFMSATASRMTALDEKLDSAADDSRPMRPRMLFQIKMGLSDVAADVEFVSQCPEDREVIFAPRTGLEIVSKPWVEGSTIVIDLRVVSVERQQTLAEVTGRMKSLHMQLLDLMLGELKLAGAPQRALLSLAGLRHESLARDAAEFNIPTAFCKATEQALASQRAVMHALGDAALWRDEEGEDHEIVQRMMKIIKLQARAGEDHDAIQLLMQVLLRQPLAPELLSKISAAERAVAERLLGTRIKKENSDAARLAEEERTPLQAAVMLLSKGATPPWPATMTTLLSSLGDRATQVFGTMISTVDPGRARPSFASGAPVLAWSETHHRWEDGIVRAARGRGLFEVKTPDSDATILPAKHVLRVAGGGAGALLYEAARNGTPQLVDALLRGGVSVFEADAHANTPLHFAVQRGNPIICQRLLAAGADPEVQNREGVTAWDLALQKGHASVRRIFAPSAADRDLSKPVTGRGASPLLVAAYTGDVDGLKELLAAGVAKETSPSGLRRIDDVWRAGQTTPLMLASRRGDLDAVNALLRAGADAGMASKRKATAISMAAEEGRTEVIHALLEAGAEVDLPDDDGFTPLGVACDNGHVGATRALIDASSDPNYARSNGWTHLITSAYNGYIDTVRALSEGGADIDLAKSSGYSAMIAAAFNGFDQMVSVLLELGATADAAMSNGWNALMVACAQGHASVVARLCEAGALVDYARPSNGFSALMVSAATFHGATSANILLQHRASVDQKDKNGATALMHAACHGHEGAVEVLIQGCATINHARLGGTTALMDAAASGHEHVVTLLLEARADADAVDAHGFTALIHAARLGNDAAMLPLLRATQGINRKDKSGLSALDHARAPAAIARLLGVGAEQSREFRKRMHEMEEDGKGPVRKLGESPKKTPTASSPGTHLSGSQSARTARSPSTRGGPPSSPGHSVKNPRQVAARQRRSSVGGQSSFASGLFNTANQIDEATVAREASARTIQQRFRTRHSTGNRPEARLFDMLKQVQESLSNHH